MIREKQVLGLRKDFALSLGLTWHLSEMVYENTIYTL